MGGALTTGYNTSIVQAAQSIDIAAAKARNHYSHHVSLRSKIMEDFDSISNSELQAIADFRKMSDWLVALSDEDYDRYMALPLAARLATFRRVCLRHHQDNLVNRLPVAMSAQPNYQTTLVFG